MLIDGFPEEHMNSDHPNNPKIIPRPMTLPEPFSLARQMDVDAYYARIENEFMALVDADEATESTLSTFQASSPHAAPTLLNPEVPETSAGLRYFEAKLPESPRNYYTLQPRWDLTIQASNTYISPTLLNPEVPELPSGVRYFEAALPEWPKFYYAPQQLWKHVV